MKTTPGFMLVVWVALSATAVSAQSHYPMGISLQPPSGESAARFQRTLDGAEAHSRAGNAALTAGKRAEAEKQFLLAYLLMPQDGRLLLTLAHLCQKEGKNRESLRFWHELIYPQNWGSSVSSDPRVRSEYILLLLARPDPAGAAWQEAAALYNRTLQESGQAVNVGVFFDPKHPAYEKLRARAHAVLGSTNYAHGPASSSDKIADLQKAARTLPNDPNVLLNLGLALEKAHRFEEAARALHRVEALHPTDTRTALLAKYHARDADLRVQMIKHPPPTAVLLDDHRTHSRRTGNGSRW